LVLAILFASIANNPASMSRHSVKTTNHKLHNVVTKYTVTKYCNCSSCRRCRPCMCSCCIASIEHRLPDTGMPLSDVYAKVSRPHKSVTGYVPGR